MARSSAIKMLRKECHINYVGFVKKIFHRKIPLPLNAHETNSLPFKGRGRVGCFLVADTSAHPLLTSPRKGEEQNGSASALEHNGAKMSQ
ncbi:hypothetical protein CEQ50_18370 [Vibrio anguillarum]|nr:hypothetical protein CEQ50_18370 [Vibrio anguillarum]